MLRTALITLAVCKQISGVQDYSTAVVVDEFAGLRIQIARHGKASAAIHMIKFIVIECMDFSTISSLHLFHNLTPHEAPSTIDTKMPDIIKAACLLTG